MPGARPLRASLRTSLLMRRAWAVFLQAGTRLCSLALASGLLQSGWYLAAVQARLHSVPAGRQAKVLPQPGHGCVSCCSQTGAWLLSRHACALLLHTGSSPACCCLSCVAYLGLLKAPALACFATLSGLGVSRGRAQMLRMHVEQQRGNLCVLCAGWQLRALPACHGLPQLPCLAQG